MVDSSSPGAVPLSFLTITSLIFQNPQIIFWRSNLWSPSPRGWFWGDADTDNMGTTHSNQCSKTSRVSPAPQGNLQSWFPGSCIISCLLAFQSNSSLFSLHTWVAHSLVTRSKLSSWMRHAFSPPDCTCFSTSWNTFLYFVSGWPLSFPGVFVIWPAPPSPDHARPYNHLGLGLCFPQNHRLWDDRA